MQQGYKLEFGAIGYDTPDFGLLNDLRFNVGVFSAFKNHSQIQQTVKLLKDENGRIRPFNDFKNEALKLNSTYNKQWLRVEYDTAIATANAARRWNDAQNTKAIFPNLRYISVNDDRTRPLHRNWHNIVLPIDHPFWNTHYPPNDYGCRCVARPTDAPIDNKGVEVNNLPKLPPQFNINAGQSGKVFNNEHPYFDTANFKGVAKQAQSALLNVQRDEIKTYIRNTNLVGKKITSQIGLITLTNKGFKEILNQPHNNMHLRNNLIYDIENVVNKATFIQATASLKDNPMVKQYHYLRVKVANQEMFLNVRELVSGELNLYSITDRIK